MFKKKAVLPARPPYPRDGEVFEDLALATDSDVVFTMIPSSACKFPNIVSAVSVNKQSESSVQREEKDLSSPDKCYRKIKTFDEKVEYTEKNIEILKEQHQKLSEIKQALVKDLTEIKQTLLQDQEKAKNASS